VALRGITLYRIRKTFCSFLFAIFTTFVAIDFVFKISFSLGALEHQKWPSGKEKSELWPALRGGITVWGESHLLGYVYIGIVGNHS
jgi:hypothetical protein